MPADNRPAESIDWSSISEMEFMDLIRFNSQPDSERAASETVHRIYNETRAIARESQAYRNVLRIEAMQHTYHHFRLIGPAALLPWQASPGPGRSSLVFPLPSGSGAVIEPVGSEPPTRARGTLDDHEVLSAAPIVAAVLARCENASPRTKSSVAAYAMAVWAMRFPRGNTQVHSGLGLTRIVSNSLIPLRLVHAGPTYTPSGQSAILALAAFADLDLLQTLRRWQGQETLPRAMRAAIVHLLRNGPFDLFDADTHLGTPVTMRQMDAALWEYDASRDNYAEPGLPARNMARTARAESTPSIREFVRETILQAASGNAPQFTVTSLPTHQENQPMPANDSPSMYRMPADRLRERLTLMVGGTDMSRRRIVGDIVRRIDAIMAYTGHGGPPSHTTILRDVIRSLASQVASDYGPRGLLPFAFGNDIPNRNGWTHYVNHYVQLETRMLEPATAMQVMGPPGSQVWRDLYTTQFAQQFGHIPAVHPCIQFVLPPVVAALAIITTVLESDVPGSISRRNDRNPEDTLHELFAWVANAHAMQQIRPGEHRQLMLIIALAVSDDEFPDALCHLATRGALILSEALELIQSVVPPVEAQIDFIARQRFAQILRESEHLRFDFADFDWGDLPPSEASVSHPPHATPAANATPGRRISRIPVACISLPAGTVPMPPAPAPLDARPAKWKARQPKPKSARLAEARKIALAVQGGEEVAAVAAKFTVSVATAWRACRAHGVEAAANGGRPASAKTLAILKAVMVDRMKQSEIHRRVGVSRQRVSRVIADARTAGLITPQAARASED